MDESRAESQARDPPDNRAFSHWSDDETQVSLSIDSKQLSLPEKALLPPVKQPPQCCEDREPKQWSNDTSKSPSQLEDAVSQSDTRSLSSVSSDETRRPPDFHEKTSPQLEKTLLWKIQRTLMVVLPTLIIAGIVPFAITGTGWQYPSYSDSHGCDAGGNVWVRGVERHSLLSVWNISYALSVTMPITTFKTFSAAKAVDIVWDLFVGRGYQLLSAIFVYKIYRVVMFDFMKTCSLPHRQVVAMQYSTTSLWGLWSYVKGIRHQPWRSTQLPASSFFKMVVLVLSVMYVLAAPTWLSAMTAYQASMRPMIWSEGNYILFDDLELCQYGIVDGSRIGLHDDYCVPSESALADAIENYTYSDPCLACYPRVTGHKGGPTPWLDRNQPKEFFKSFNSEYVKRQNCDLRSLLEIDGQKYALDSPILDIRGGTYSHRNRTLLGTHLVANGTCTPLDTYVWGFSFLLLFPFAVITVVLATCLFFIWFRRQNHFWPQQVDSVFGDLRTALVVANSIYDELGASAHAMSNSELEETLATLNLGVDRGHDKSRIGFLPSPREKERTKRKPVKLPVGSERYNAYLQSGYESLRRSRRDRSIYGELGETAHSMSDSELERRLPTMNPGVNRANNKSNSLSLPNLHGSREKKQKAVELEVGSLEYQAYMKYGLASLTKDTSDNNDAAEMG